MVSFYITVGPNMSPYIIIVLSEVSDTDFWISMLISHIENKGILIFKPPEKVRDFGKCPTPSVFSLKDEKEFRKILILVCHPSPRTPTIYTQTRKRSMRRRVAKRERDERILELKFSL